MNVPLSLPRMTTSHATPGILIVRGQPMHVPLLTSHDDSACPAPEAPLGDCGPLLVGEAGFRRPSPVPACEWPGYVVWVGFTSRWCNHLTACECRWYVYHADDTLCRPSESA